MEENQVVIEMPQVEFKMNSVANNATNESEEIIEYCLEAATNITQPVKNEGDHDTFSDEGNEKVLTTLETIQADSQEDEETYSTYEVEDLPANEQLDNANAPATAENVQLSESEIARLQLESLGTQKVGRPKKTQVTILDEKGNISTKSLCGTDESSTKVETISSVTLESPSLTIEETIEEVCEDVTIPVDELSLISSATNEGDYTLENRMSNLTESPSTGIEIPKELITGSALTSPMFVQNNSKPLQNEDLLAILEGNDESFEENNSADTSMTSEEEKVVALKQMLSLPVNPRGRRPNPAKAKKKETKPKTSNLVNSLVSDWSDNDSKKEESEGEEKPKQTPKSSKPVAVINQQIDNERSERRSRIIKKKIIWDPDAPETAFSYASLVQSGPKKPKISQAKAKEKEKEKEVDEAVEVRKRKSESTSPAALKKKRVGEIDKLLADEGAINILNALKHENNNADHSDADSIPGEKSPSKRLARKVNSEANDAVEPTKPDTPNQKNARKPKNATVPVKKEPKKRGSNKSAASASWDYIYNDKLGQRGDDSMIIRRRSNSSYSSTTSLRLSIDGTLNESDKISEPNEKKFEFAKPIVKKNSTSESSPQRQLILSDLRGKGDKKGISKVDENVVRRSSRATVVESVELSNVKAVAEQHKKQETQSNKRKGTEKINDATFTEINVQILKHCAHIVLTPNVSAKVRNSFSIQMMDEVTRALKDLSTNSTVRAVLISSSNTSFCNGIDFSNLVQNTVDKRKQLATELSTSLRDFITSIATFKKILIAGVHGHTVGVGVTILPLFDIVYASNKASFSTPYVKIGQVPENGTIFLKSNKISHRLKTELFYLDETVKSTDALQSGLITKIINSEVFESEIVHQTEQIALQSSQSMEATKSLTHFDIIDKLDDDLAKEQKLLTQHWATSECQDRFKNFLSKEKWQN